MTKIPALHVGQALAFGPVTLFPVWTDTTPARELCTGPAARVEVSELTTGPNIGQLSVYNSGDKPIMLLEGELLEGGWQTRTMVRDVIIAAGQQMAVDVACVEQHRWGGDNAHGRRARRATASVQSAMRGHEDGRQRRVWDGVQRYETLTGATASGSLTDHLDRVAALAPPRLLAGQNGVVVGIGGQPISLEVFGTRAALKSHLAGILDAALLEAGLFGSPVPVRVPARRARRFTQGIQAIHWQPAVPLAPATRAWTGRNNRVTLRALTVDSGLAHLSAVTT